MAIAAAAALSSGPRAQLRVAPPDDQQGHVALGLALRHLGNTGVFMMATAHPDDENNALLVMLNRGLGYRTALATATRGNGGQNEIGPEIFEALGVLRTEELAALHRFDGAEQYFTRAVDFGNSFSVEETFEKWGREEILGDFVRLIRTVRPDVMTGLTPTGNASGQHHQASAILAREAFKAAGDSSRFPEQLTAGLRPWQPRKFYFSADFAGARGAGAGAGRLTIDLAGYDALLGRTYAEIGTEARSMHKCQGMAQLLSLPGPASSSYDLIETAAGQASAPAGRGEASLFDGVDTTIPGLARFAGARVPRELTQGLAAVAAAVQTAERRFASESDEATLQPLLAGLRALHALRAGLRDLPLDETAKFELDFRLRQKDREFQQAILIANNIRVEALANDGVVVAGQPVGVTLLVANRGASDVTVKQVRFAGFGATGGDGGCTLSPVVNRGRGGQAPSAGPAVSTLRKDQAAQCEVALRVPADARVSEPYWHRAGESGRYTFDADAPFGLPYRPTPFYVQTTLAFPGGDEVTSGQIVQYRYQGDIFGGEKRTELLVAPRFSVTVSPEIAVVPAGAAGSTRELRATVVNLGKEGGDARVSLALPRGWAAVPAAAQTVRFAREDESQTVRFELRTGTAPAPGDNAVAVSASAGGQTFARGMQVIEYPHTRRQHIYEAADAIVKAIDVKIAPNLTVGYVMGVGDEVPAAIEQLGAKLQLIGADELAWGNLSRYSAIVTGVRAYERRADLRANNSRLLEYARNGGTVIVQYNKFEFNEAQYGPFPAKVSSDRVTDEHAPVKVIDAASPVFTTPNRIGPSAWEGWVQERGLYFLGEKDSRYRDLVSMSDPFPYNAGEKRGALVMASVGTGRWVYVGLGLWRELPAGVPGAYQLLANLLSLGKR